MYEVMGSKKANDRKVLKYHYEIKMRRYRILSTVGLCVNKRVGKNNLYLCLLVYA